jgi:peptide/nickel transport system permease protein
MSNVKRRSQFSSVLHRFAKNKLAVVGVIIFFVMAFGALTADIFFDYKLQALDQNAKDKFLPPSREHIFGTDHYGRDLFVRIVYGGRISLIVGFFTAGFGLIFGTIIGASAGYFGGKVDNILMRIMDIFLAIPAMLLAICIVAALGGGLFNLLLANGIANVPRYSRIVRGHVMGLKNSEFIEAARASGANDKRIIFKHIIPNALGQLIVQATLTMAMAILSVASLSFVGLGINPPTPEWGSMLSTGKEFMRTHPNQIVIPGLAIMMAVLSFNLIGDGLRDALDPRLKN